MKTYEITAFVLILVIMISSFAGCSLSNNDKEIKMKINNDTGNIKTGSEEPQRATK